MTGIHQAALKISGDEAPTGNQESNRKFKKVYNSKDYGCGSLNEISTGEPVLIKLKSDVVIQGVIKENQDCVFLIEKDKGVISDILKKNIKSLAIYNPNKYKRPNRTKHGFGN